jgi:hypothetical protein
MNAARAALGGPGPGTGAGAMSAGGTAEGGDPGPERAPPRLRVLDPEAVQSLVRERLAAWEEERQGRWQRLIELLFKRRRTAASACPRSGR